MNKFQLRFTKSFQKDLKKLEKEVINKFVNKWLPKIQEHPYIGKKLKYISKDNFYRVPFRHKKNDYRIVYEIKGKELVILLLAIGSRENFYKNFS
jgi:mRNA interferase RelE/StbE